MPFTFSHPAIGMLCPCIILMANNRLLGDQIRIQYLTLPMLKAKSAIGTIGAITGLK